MLSNMREQLLKELRRLGTLQFWLICAACESMGSDDYDERAETYADSVLIQWTGLTLEEYVQKTIQYIMSTEFGFYPEQPGDTIG